MSAQPYSRRTLLRHAALSAAALGLQQFALACAGRPTPATMTPISNPSPSAEPAATATPSAEPIVTAIAKATPAPPTAEPTLEPTAAEPTFPTPLRWGFDDAGGPAHLEQTSWAAQCISEFGFDTWVMHYMPASTVEFDIAQIRRIDAWCAKQGVQWILNLEDANWVASHTDSKGREWYNRADGRQYFLFPDDILAELGKCKQLRGLMYDEAEHMQDCRHLINSINKPFFYDPEDQRLVDAAEGMTAACREIAEHHARFGLHLFTESVFPVMLDNFARAGFTATTKILKGNWSPAYYAVALGAALEYGRELWITPDLWGDCGQGGFMNNGYPGHSVEEYRSALLMAYALGADSIYTENLAYNHLSKGLGSLVLTKALKYTVTPYGAITRTFRQEYVPAHPRMYRWQDVRPRTAIIHQTDGCWGQRASWLPEDVRTAAGQGLVSDGKGKWLASETFLDDAVRQAVEPVLPHEDELTYRFGNTRVTLRPVNGDPNNLEVESGASLGS